MIQKYVKRILNCRKVVYDGFSKTPPLNGFKVDEIKEVQEDVVKLRLILLKNKLLHPSLGTETSSEVNGTKISGSYCYLPMNSVKPY